MKSLQLSMGLMCLSFGMLMVAAQEQILDVSIRIQSDTSFRRGNVDASDLEKYGRFGMKKAEPFGTYFYVESALYHDFLDNQGCVRVQQDLLKKIPQMIQKDQPKKRKLESVGKYKFPKYVSGSFVERVKTAQQDGSPIKHTIYKDGQRALVLRYKVELEAALVSSVQVVPVKKDSCQIESSFEDDSMLHLGATFLWLLSIANL